MNIAWGKQDLTRNVFDDEENNAQPPSTCQRCGTTTKFGGRCECEQILW